MSWLQGSRARLRLLFARRAAESRMDAEFRFHLEMETERLARERGLEPQEARRQALVAFGGVEKHKEELRDGRGLAWLGGLSLDLKLGLRMLARSPGLTLVGVLGMAVAIAIGTVAFGIIYEFIGTTVPLHDGERVVAIQNVDTRQNVEGEATHLHDIQSWRESLRAVEEIGAYRIVNRNLISRGARPEPIRLVEMTASGFRIARVPPLLGRAVHDADERPGAPPVVVIGHDMWQLRFAGDRDIVGRTVQIGATVHTVIGVMPQGFAFPVNNRIWTPLRLDPLQFERGEAPPVQVFGRLAPGATVDDAQAQMTTIAARLASEHPTSHQHIRPRVLPYALSFFDSPELVWALHLVQLLISMLLVVIGTNVATLVYARTASRMGEIAVRTALGASRARVIGQLFVEALVLAAVAALLGLAGAVVALWHIRAYARRLAGEQLPSWMDFAPTAGMVLYVAGLAVLAAVIVGVLPALKATRSRVHANLQHLGVSGSGIRLGRTWTVLIVAQVAIAVALLPVVLYAAVVQGREPDMVGPAIPTHEWMTATLHLDQEGDATGADTAAHAARYATLQAELVRRLEVEPGVAEVVLTSAVPGDEPRLRIEVERTAGAPGAAAAAPTGQSAGVARVDLDFFRAFGVPVLAGRGLHASDAAAAAAAVVVNRSFVRDVLGGADPLGRRVREAPEPDEDGMAGEPGGPWLVIVGVVPDFPSPERASEARPRLYQPILPDEAPPATLAVRVRGDTPIGFASRFREIAVGIDPMLRLGGVRDLDESLSVDRMASRVTLVAVSLVTLSVLLLSAAGIYALMSFTIARRQREIGIRAALGAGPRQVVASVLARAAGQIAIGIAIGIALASVVVQTMEGGFADVRGALVLAAVAALMAVIGLLAAWGPARRALRIQPTEALKSE